MGAKDPVEEEMPRGRRLRPSDVTAGRALGDDAIREAMEQGLFDDLPGKGKPLRLDPRAATPEGMAAGILREANFVPEWIELARALCQRGELWRTRGDLEAAQADWARAGALCAQMGARAWLWRIHAALGQLAVARRRMVEAEAEFAAGRAIVEELTADMRDELFRESLRRRAGALLPAEPLVLSRRAVRRACRYAP